MVFGKESAIRMIGCSNILRCFDNKLSRVLLVLPKNIIIKDNNPDILILIHTNTVTLIFLY